MSVTSRPAGYGCGPSSTDSSGRWRRFWIAARREGETLGQDIPRTEALAAAVEEAKRFRDRALADWPDPDRDFGDAPPTLGSREVAEGTAYLGPDDFTALFRGG